MQSLADWQFSQKGQGGKGCKFIFLFQRFTFDDLLLTVCGGLWGGCISSVAQCSSLLVLGSVVCYSGLTGDGILFWPTFVPLLTLVKIMFWGKWTHNIYRQYFCLF